MRKRYLVSKERLGQLLRPVLLNHLLELELSKLLVGALQNVLAQINQGALIFALELLGVKHFLATLKYFHLVSLRALWEFAA